MNKILSKQRLSQEVFRMEIEAREIAEARKSGQFIIRRWVEILESAFLSQSQMPTL